MRVGERAELGRRSRRAARSEVRVDPRLERGEPLLLQARDLGLGERRERELGAAAARATAPSASRSRRRGPVGAAGGQRLAPLGEERLEALGVQLAGPDAQAVAGGRRGDRRPASPSALRSRETCTWTVLIDDGGASSPHSATARRSALTGSLACSSSSANRARGLPPPSVTDPEAPSTSSGPSTRNSILAPTLLRTSRAR